VVRKVSGIPISKEQKHVPQARHSRDTNSAKHSQSRPHERVLSLSLMFLKQLLDNTYMYVLMKNVAICHTPQEYCCRENLSTAGIPSTPFHAGNHAKHQPRTKSHALRLTCGSVISKTGVGAACLSGIWQDIHEQGNIQTEQLRSPISASIC
jgi:hypothetical protein